MTSKEIQLPDGLDAADAASVLQDYGTLDEPTIVEQEQINAHDERVETLEEIMNDRLVSDRDLKESTVEAMSFEAKAAEFENDEGEFDAETLIQTPEAGSTETGGEDLDSDAEALAEEWGDGDVDEAVETLQERYENFESIEWESQAEEAANQLETLGVEV